MILLQNSLLYSIPVKKNKKIECPNDYELRKYIDNVKLYDVLSLAKEKMRFDSDIQNFEKQCFSVNDSLNKYGLFLRVNKLKDKFCYLFERIT